ncbi:hypothetical protein [Rufibacter roseolus]|uniref:hypothetical protein n=1 Tax=Rufibacter roseolus TaxID=2817375 RepID=UPI001B31205E|nr:hypothetical protein [Rufibacter roseolus]
MILVNNIYLDSTLFERYAFSFNSYRDNLVQLIRFSSIENRSEWLTEVSNNVHFPSFSILFDGEPNIENLKWLVRFSYLLKFNKVNNLPIVFIEKSDCEAPVREVFSRQGYHKTNIVNLKMLITCKIGSLAGLVHYEEKIGGIDFIVNIIEPAFTFEGIADCPRVVDYSVFFNTKMDILQQLKSLNKICAEQEATIKDLSFELENQKKYLEIALRQKETEQILEFYHQEYEVLPLWFKRLGHVVKIALGRRKLVR